MFFLRKNQLNQFITNPIFANLNSLNNLTSNQMVQNQFYNQNQNFFQHNSPSSNLSRLSINSPQTDYRFLNINSHNGQASQLNNTLNKSPSIKRKKQITDTSPTKRARTKLLKEFISANDDIQIINEKEFVSKCKSCNSSTHVNANNLECKNNKKKKSKKQSN